MLKLKFINLYLEATIINFILHKIKHSLTL